MLHRVQWEAPVSCYIGYNGRFPFHVTSDTFSVPGSMLRRVRFPFHVTSGSFPFHVTLGTFSVPVPCYIGYVFRSRCKLHRVQWEAPVSCYIGYNGRLPFHVLSGTLIDLIPSNCSTEYYLDIT